jgi:DNA-binding NarL/FixJ family response regulator
MESGRSISVFVCETQPIAIAGLEKVLSDHADLRLAGSASTLVDALYGIANLQPDILIVDQAFGLRAALELIADARNASPWSHAVLWITDLAETDCFHVLQAGVRGILRKAAPARTLVECLRSVVGGSVWLEDLASGSKEGLQDRKQTPRLTPRERQIVHYVCQGLKNRQIGEALRITPGTVKVHLMHIFEKTGTKDRVELAVFGRGLGAL